MSTEPLRKAVGSIFDITITGNAYNAQYFRRQQRLWGLFSTKVQLRYSFNFFLRKLLRMSVGQSLYTGTNGELHRVFS